MTAFLTPFRPPLLLALALGSGALAGCRHVRDEGSTCPGGDGLQAAQLLGQDMPQRSVALTIDGGPAPTTTTLVDVLAAHGVQATFFLDGRSMAGEGEALARLKTKGHLVGNRGYSGASLAVAPDPVTEVRKTDELMTPYVSGNVYLLRAPMGEFSEALASRLNDAGLTRYVGPIGADVESSCGSDDSADACAQATIEAVRAADHGIVAFDGAADVTVDVLRILLPKLKTEGFTFQRLDQVTPIKEALVRSGAAPGTVGGPGGCQEYGE